MRTILSALVALSLAPVAALAHHGWSWTTGEDVELTGVIREADLRLPHGVLALEVGGEVWTVEVGQPWRNERAGLAPDDLSPGVEITVEGQPSAAPDERRLKAERLRIGDREFVLYPDRD